MLSAEHVVVLIATAALSGLVVWLPRMRPGSWIVPASRALAALILAGLIADHIAAAAIGRWTLRTYLPLHLSDAATIVTVVALWTAHPRLVELTYFWGLTASLQATITPELGDAFPELLFFTFFVTHAGIVVAALLLVVGRRLAPRLGAVRRAFAATLAVALVAAVGCLATGGNYMFLRDKPSGSLLDLMGPWPWYIVGAGVLALALFTALDVPFRRRPPSRVAPSG